MMVTRDGSGKISEKASDVLFLLQDYSDPSVTNHGSYI
jgi:hypothetical protein